LTTIAIDPPAFMTWTTDIMTWTTSFLNSSALVPADAGDHSIAMRVCDIWNACTTESFKLTIN